ncbi:NADP-dependent oxidoreductase [Lentzea sp. NEAU-D7]|uniref:NADP-dependent oxidoreductase n=1 Tax=Lentzea sp. NEAU-D7 TaxID=2994667 RepID=UPI00224A4AB3|nr:NADP-dependent oxidoreductase [Lentzea sp. NEAU-D7]MCX2948540.1 NADP-dependent oxidoreductase [Lentzea sp. NEAU-D7]
MWAIAAADFGAELELVELPAPTPEPGQLLVRLLAASVNPFDRKVVDGMLRDSAPHRFPLVPGTDGAGVVEGSGERIFGTFFRRPVGGGTYAEYVTVPSTNALAPLPEDVDPAVAAALPTAGMTALQLVESLGTAESVLIVGASGGVGSFAVQIARAAGKRVVPIGRGDSPVEADALIDLVSTDRSSFEANARYAPLAFNTNYVSADPAQNFGLKGSRELLERLVSMVRSGDLEVPIARRVPLREATGVFAGHGPGKTVIIM